MLEMTIQPRQPGPEREVALPGTTTAQSRDPSQGPVSETPQTSQKEQDDTYQHAVTWLSDCWRAIVCRDRIQWILQRRKGNRWRSRCFCLTSSALEREALRCCGDIEPAALEVIRALPEHINGSFDDNSSRAGRAGSRAAVAQTLSAQRGLRRDAPEKPPSLDRLHVPGKSAASIPTKKSNAFNSDVSTLQRISENIGST
jgi:hypothetical protein